MNTVKAILSIAKQRLMRNSNRVIWHSEVSEIHYFSVDTGHTDVFELSLIDAYFEIISNKKCCLLKWYQLFAYWQKNVLNLNENIFDFDSSFSWSEFLMIFKLFCLQIEVFCFFFKQSLCSGLMWCWDAF